MCVFGECIGCCVCVWGGLCICMHLCVVQIRDEVWCPVLCATFNQWRNTMFLFEVCLCKSFLRQTGIFQCFVMFPLSLLYIHGILWHVINVLNRLFDMTGVTLLLLSWQCFGTNIADVWLSLGTKIRWFGLVEKELWLSVKFRHTIFLVGLGYD